MESLLKQFNRIQKAARLGFLWRGTSRFTPPREIRWRGQRYTLSLPAEAALKGVFSGVILDDEYGVQVLKTAPRTIIDVGGNVGLFSFWARANFPDASIHTYEPNPALQKHLLANCAQFNSRVYCEAVAGKEGRASLEAREGESVAGRCALDRIGEVKVTSLRTAIERIGGDCDLLKLDCEGAEWDMLQHPEMFDGVRLVRMEYHLLKRDQSLDSLVGAFRSMGFRAVHLIRDPERGLAWFDREKPATLRVSTNL